MTSNDRREYNRQWRAHNHERTLEHARRSRKKNLDRVRERERKWASEHREQIHEYQREWYLRNRDGVLARRKKLASEHPEVERERQRSAYLDLRTRAMAAIAAHYGDLSPRCRFDLTPHQAMCSHTCFGQLQIDHISGGGRQDGKNPQKFYRAIAGGSRSLEGLRILCELHNTVWKILAQQDLYTRPL